MYVELIPWLPAIACHLNERPFSGRIQSAANDRHWVGGKEGVNDLKWVFDGRIGTFAAA